MIAKKEVREERNDVLSFWETKKVLNENEEIEEVEVKIDECTILELEKRIVTHNEAIAELNKKVISEQTKINLAELLNEVEIIPNIE